MSEIREEGGQKPEESLSCFVDCPHCKKRGDYWQTAAHTYEGERNFLGCLYCHERFEVVGLGDHALGVKSDYERP